MLGVCYFTTFVILYVAHFCDLSYNHNKSWLLNDPFVPSKNSAISGESLHQVSLIVISLLNYNHMIDNVVFIGIVINNAN